MQREAEAAHQEGMQQAAGETNKRLSRGKPDAGALTDMRWRFNERASVDNVRLAGGGQ